MRSIMLTSLTLVLITGGQAASATRDCLEGVFEAWSTV